MNLIKILFFVFSFQTVLAAVQPTCLGVANSYRIQPYHHEKYERAFKKLFDPVNFDKIGEEELKRSFVVRGKILGEKKETDFLLVSNRNDFTERMLTDADDTSRLDLAPGTRIFKLNSKKAERLRGREGDIFLENGKIIDLSRPLNPVLYAQSEYGPSALRGISNPFVASYRAELLDMMGKRLLSRRQLLESMVRINSFELIQVPVGEGQ